MTYIYIFVKVYTNVFLFIKTRVFIYVTTIYLTWLLLMAIYDVMVRFVEYVRKYNYTGLVFNDKNMSGSYTQYFHNFGKVKRKINRHNNVRGGYGYGIGFTPIGKLNHSFADNIRLYENISDTLFKWYI